MNTVLCMAACILKTGMIWRFPWLLPKDDTQIHEHSIFLSCELKNNYFFHSFIHCVYGRVQYSSHSACVEVRDNLREFPSLYHMGPGNRLRPASLAASIFLFPLSHLTNLVLFLIV